MSRCNYMYTFKIVNLCDHTFEALGAHSQSEYLCTHACTCQGRIQDSMKGGSFQKRARIFKATPTRALNHAHFRLTMACSKSSVTFDGR